MDFVESNMLFSFKEQNVFRIEQADIIQNKNDIKVCECLAFFDDRMWLVEAKSSSPMPQNKDFDDYIDDISQKFIDTLMLFNALSIGRHGGTEKGKLPPRIQCVSLADIPYSICLIVHGNKDEWMMPIQDALKLKLKHCLKSWNISDTNVYALNHETAKRKGLIKSFLPMDVLYDFKHKGLRDVTLKSEVEKWFCDNRI